MEQLTVRRWIEAPIDEVWERLTDVDALVSDRTGFDLVEVVSDGPMRPGDILVLSRRHGARLATFQVRVVSTLPPRHLCLSIVSGRVRWMIRIDLDPLSEQACDVAIRARHDRGTPGLVPLTPPSPGALYRLDADLTELLDAIARRAETDDLAGTHPR